MWIIIPIFAPQKGSALNLRNIANILSRGTEKALATAGCLCVDMGCLAMILQVARVAARFS